MADNIPIKADDNGKKPVARIFPLQKIAKKAEPPTGEALVEGAENPYHIIRITMWIIIVFFGFFGVASFFVHISGAVVAQGRIKLESERKIVQHLEGGIIDEILVHEGEEVKSGQPLVILQSVSVDANKNMLTSQHMNLEARRIRLLAEKEQWDKLAWPEEVKKLAAELGGLEALANEEKVFTARRASLGTQINLLKTQLAQLNAQVKGFEDQLHAEGNIIKALREELAAKRKMLQQRFIDKPQVLGLEKDLAGHEGTRGRLRQQIAEAKQKGAELNLHIVNTLGKFVEEATTNLAETEKELTQVREQIRPLADAKQRLQVLAPVSGTIVDLKIHSKGGVIQPGETLMDIVPEDHPLIIETRLPVNDITDVYIGQPADIQLDAFDYRTTPRIPGKLTYISADSLQDPNGFAYYLCYVEIDKKALADANLYIAPGMSATVYIRTRERTIFYYMFEPLIIQWDKSLRD